MGEGRGMGGGEIGGEERVGEMGEKGGRRGVIKGGI